MSSKFVTFILLALSVAPLFLLTSPASFAQWSSDPNINLAVCDTSGSQELPKIVATSDGGCYVSWFDTRAGAYRVYMQRLDAQGVKQWGANGLLISANPQSTSLVDWDLAVDDSNNAIVAFTDTRNGSSINPFAYKISSQGDFRWGANGVQLSNATTVYQANPKIARTSDGNFVFVWLHGTSPNQVAMQKLNAAGTKQWGVDPILISGGAEHRWRPSIVGSDSGSVILLYAGFTGTTLNPQNYKLLTQKVSPTGTTIWADTVYSLGQVSGFFEPKIFSDGNNGAFYVWHDQRSGANSTSYVQHFTSTATKLFPINGSASSTLAGRLHNDAWIAYTPLNGETYMFWYETNASTQSIYGVYGQKFSSNGTRMWPDSGIAFKPLAGSTQPSFIRAFAKDSSAVVFYLQLVTGTTHVVKGFRTDRIGNLLWGGAIKDVSSLVSGKGRLTGALTSSGNSILGWADNRQDGNGVYAQELNYSGQLGVVTSVIQVRDNAPSALKLDQNYPNPFNPTTTLRYALPMDARVTLSIYNILGQRVVTLKDEVQSVGYYDVVWDGRNDFGSQASSGVYFYRIEARPIDGGNAFAGIKKMMFLK